MIKLIINKIASILEQDPSGTLRSSIKANVISENTIRLGVVGDLIYARVHQFSAVITPKNAKALTIPINKESRYLSASEIRLI